MIDKSRIFENIQNNNFELTVSEGTNALYAVIRDFEYQSASLERLVIDYIIKYKNMFRTDSDAYDSDTFLAGFTSTIELSIHAASDSTVSIRTLDRCNYYSKHYNYITSLKCSEFHRMLAMITEGSTGIVSSSRLYSVIMRQGEFRETLEEDTLAAFLQVYDAMLFAIIKKHYEQPEGQKHSYAAYKDILGLCNRMEDAYGSENPLVGYIKYSLATLEESLLHSTPKLY